MHFKQLRDIELDIFRNRVFMIVMLFEQIAFIGSLDELNMHQLCQHITTRISKHILLKSCPKNCSNICDCFRKKKKVLKIH